MPEQTPHEAVARALDDAVASRGVHGLCRELQELNEAVRDRVTPQAAALLRELADAAIVACGAGTNGDAAGTEQAKKAAPTVHFVDPAAASGDAPRAAPSPAVQPAPAHAPTSQAQGAGQGQARRAKRKALYTEVPVEPSVVDVLEEVRRARGGKSGRGHG